MSKVRFGEDAKLAYVSSPLKIPVHLSQTKTDLFIGASGSAVQPAPTSTVARSINLRTNHFFDVTAWVKEVQESRQRASNRSSFVVKNYDVVKNCNVKITNFHNILLHLDT